LNITSTGKSLIAEENQYIGVGCEVCFTGYATVNVSCSSDKEESFAALPTWTDLNESCQTYRKTYVLEKRLRNSKFTCTVQMIYESSSLLNDSWTSGIVEIHYGPTSTQIQAHYKDTSAVKHSYVLYCTAEGFPEPKYSWQVANETVYDGQMYVVDICTLTNGLEHGMNETTRWVTFDCSARGYSKPERQSTTVNVSVVEYKRSCADGSNRDVETYVSGSAAATPSSTILVIGASAVFVLLVVITVVVCVSVRKCGQKRRRRTSQGRRSVGADTFYNDASGTNKQVGPYEDIPDANYPETFDAYDQPEETYDELQETSMLMYDQTTQVVVEGQLETMPYKQLDVESRDPTRPSNPYTKLADAGLTSDTVTGGEQVPAPCQGLELHLRELPPLPGTDSAKQSYEVLDTLAREIPKPPTEYKKLDCTVTQPPAADNESHSTSSYETLQNNTNEERGAYKKLDETANIKQSCTTVTVDHSYVQVLAEHE
jgi:hypothetical protein